MRPAVTLPEHTTVLVAVKSLLESDDWVSHAVHLFCPLDQLPCTDMDLRAAADATMRRLDYVHVARDEWFKPVRALAAVDLIPSAAVDGERLFEIAHPQLAVLASLQRMLVLVFQAWKDSRRNELLTMRYRSFAI